MLSLTQEMFAAERRTARTRKSFRIAFAASLVLHALAVFYPLLFDQPLGGVDSSRHHVSAPLQARLHQRAQVAPPAAPAPQPSQKNRKQSEAKVITSKKGNWAAPSRPVEERQPSGAELVQRALAMARGIGRQELDGGEDAISTQQEAKLKEIEPTSLEWYFNSFISKLNRSAQFVPRAAPSKGQRAAEVQIIINRDGSLRDYRIVRAADRQIEVDYIRAVVERAVPFAAFPQQISSKTDTLPLTICIQPPGEDGGGFGFTRTGGKRC